jgi:hypothetical protein
MEEAMLMKLIPPTAMDGIDHTIVHASGTAHRMIRAPGTPTNEAIVVCSGLVAIFALDAYFNRRILALRFPGEAILPNERAAHTGVTALVASTVAIGPDVNLQHAEAYDVMLRNNRIAQEWLMRCGLDTTARVAHLFCEMAVRGGYSDQIPNLLTQTQIGDITAQTSVNVNRIMADMTAAGLISREGYAGDRVINLLNREELERICAFRAHPFN